MNVIYDILAAICFFIFLKYIFFAVRKTKQAEQKWHDLTYELIILKISHYHVKYKNESTIKFKKIWLSSMDY